MDGSSKTEHMISGPTGSTPIPDPTALTTAQIRDAIGALRDYTDGQLEVLRERLDGIDRATDIRLESGDDISAEIDAKVAHTRAISDEKFSSVEQKFGLWELQRVEQKQDTKVAVDAALISQKEAFKEQTTASERAIAKSESATTKSIEQLGDKFDTAIDGLRREVADVKDRLTTAEASKAGATETSEQHNVTLSQVIAAVGVGVAMLGFAITVVIQTVVQ